MRALGWFARGEDSVARRWLSALGTWMNRVRPNALRPIAAGGPPDPSAASQEQALWTQLMDERVIPEIRRLFDTSYRTIAPASDPNVDQRAIDYLQGVRNRLSHIPDQVYAQIVADVERGIRDGQTIDEIATAIQRRLTVAGSPYWAGRARTIARTETVGASNGGAFAAAVARALEEGDAEATKVWISTLDGRTRLEHRECDRQVQPLLQPFDVGGAQLMFPGDPSGPAHLVINCRCSILDIVGGMDLDWTNRQFQGAT